MFINSEDWILNNPKKCAEEWGLTDHKTRQKIIRMCGLESAEKLGDFGIDEDKQEPATKKEDKNIKNVEDLFNEGFIIVHRSIINSSVFHNPSVFRVYIYLLLKANYKDKKLIIDNQVVKIKRGQFLTSYDSMLNELNYKVKKKDKLTIKKLRGRIGALKRANKIDFKGFTKYSMITVLNYNKWQDKDKKGQTKGQRNGRTEGTQRATTNNVNKENNKKLKIKKDLESGSDSFENLTDTKKRVVMSENGGKGNYKGKDRNNAMGFPF